MWRSSRKTRAASSGEAMAAEVPAAAAAAAATQKRQATATDAAAGAGAQIYSLQILLQVLFSSNGRS